MGIKKTNLILALLVSATTASWAFGLPKGRIAYVVVGQSVPEVELWILDLSTGVSNKVPLDRDAHGPNWCGSGGLIAFSTGGSGSARINTIRPDGSDVFDVTDSPWGGGPMFSGDCSELAFYAIDGGWRLHTVNADGTNRVNLGIPGVHASWSPVEDKITYSNWATIPLPYQSDIFVYDLATGVSTQITDHAANHGFVRARWSPDGRRLVASDVDHGTGKQDLWVMNADGSNLVNVTGDWSASSELYPSWSSDGEYIIFSSDRSGDLDIWAMRPDGTERVNLTNTPAIDEFTPAIGPPPACDDFEDGSIDPALWAWGGERFGIGGCGAGSWAWSHQEVMAPDGYLSMRVTGPTSGNTFGGQAWLRTLADYNDGRDHIIDFRWGAVVNATHIDSYAIQITDGTNPVCDLFWYNNHETLIDGATWKNLYAQWNQPNMPSSDWSIYIDGTNSTATLYNGPNLSGVVIGVKALPADQPWHMRFIHQDGTSGGFPAGDNLLNVYDFCATKVIRCGDGIRDLGEACDDGNTLDADGCSFACTIEPGFVCNGEPSVCCFVATPPALEQILNDQGVLVASVKNRFLSFDGGDAGRQQAARVTFVSLPGAFNVFDGTTAWVALPQPASELPGKGMNDPVGADLSFMAAKLSATPVYADWSTFGTVHVYDERIIPSHKPPALPLEPAVYEIQLVTEECDLIDDASFSLPLSITNATWADIAELAGGEFRAPDGTVEVGDILAVLAKFENGMDAPIKARAELLGTDASGPIAAIDGIISVSDLLAVLAAFSGGSYPFAPPGP